MNDMFLQLNEIFGFDIFAIFSCVLLFSIVCCLVSLLLRFANSLDNCTIHSRDNAIDNLNGGSNYEKIS